MGLKKIIDYVGPNSLSFMIDQERKHWLLKTSKSKQLVDPNTGDIYQGRIDNLGSDIVIESNKLNEIFNNVQYIQFVPRFAQIFQTEPSAFTYNSALNGLVFARIISTNYQTADDQNHHYRIHFKDAEIVYLAFGSSNSSSNVYATKWLKTTTAPVIKLMNSQGTYDTEVPVSFNFADMYTLLTEQPDDWNDNYFSYYIKTATGYQLIPPIYTEAPTFKPNSYFEYALALPGNVEYYYPLEESMQPLNVTSLTLDEWYTEGIINDNQIGLPAFWFTTDITNVGPHIKLGNNVSVANELFITGNNGNASKYRSHLYVNIAGQHDATPGGVSTDQEYVYVSPESGYEFAGNISDFNIPIDPDNIAMGDQVITTEYPGDNTRFYMSENTEWEFVNSTSYKIKVSVFDDNCYFYNKEPLVPCIDIHFDESVSFANKTSDYGFIGIRGGSSIQNSDLYPKYPYSLNKFDGLPDHLTNPDPEDPQQHMAIYAIHNSPNSVDSDPMTRQTAALLLDPGRTQHPENDIEYDFTMPEIDPNKPDYGAPGIPGYEHDIFYIVIQNPGSGLCVPGLSTEGGGCEGGGLYTLYGDDDRRICTIFCPPGRQTVKVPDPVHGGYYNATLYSYGNNYDNNGGIKHFSFEDIFVWENPKNTKTDGTGFEYKDVCKIVGNAEEGAATYTTGDLGARFRIYRNLDTSEANYTRGRVYVLSNDPIEYENNATAHNPKPARTAARICDIPTTVAQLSGTKNVAPTYVVDQDYVRTEASYSEEDRNRLYNVNSSRWVKPCHLGIDGETIEHDNDFVFTSLSQLNSIDLVNHNEFRYTENLVPMVDPSDVTISEITANGSGYEVNDFGNIFIGGFGFEYHVTSVDGSGRVEEAILSSPDLENERNINLSNFNMLDDFSPYTREYGTSPKTGSGRGLKVRLIINNYDSIKTYKGEIFSDLFALVRESDGLWLYIYNIDQSSNNTPKTGEWIRNVQISQFEANSTDTKFQSTADAFMASILPIANNATPFCVTSDGNIYNIDNLKTISTASFVQIIGDSSNKYYPIKNINELKPGSQYADICKWYCDGLKTLTGLSSLDTSGIIEKLSETEVIRSDCYIAWRPVDPDDPSNMDVVVGVIYRSFNNLRSNGNTTLLPTNALKYQNYVNSNANTTVVWDTDKFGTLVWVFNPKYLYGEKYSYDTTRNKIVVERSETKWSDVYIRTNNIENVESFVDDELKLKYNIITNNPFHPGADAHKDPNVIYDQPEFFNVCAIGTSVDARNISPVGNWQCVFPRFSQFVFHKESGGTTQSYIPTELNVIHDTNLNYDSKVYDELTGQDVSSSTIIFEDTANGVIVKLYNAENNTWEKI